MNELDDLLTRLEQLNSQLADLSDIEVTGSVDTVPVLALTEERGKVVEQLQPMLVGRAPVSYVEWNRLVVIHHQGSRILDNLRQVRSRVAVEVSANSSSRLFLERITGMLAPASGRR